MVQLERFAKKESDDHLNALPTFPYTKKSRSGSLASELSDDLVPLIRKTSTPKPPKLNFSSNFSEVSETSLDDSTPLIHLAEKKTRTKIHRHSESSKEKGQRKSKNGRKSKPKPLLEFAEEICPRCGGKEYVSNYCANCR